MNKNPTSRSKLALSAIGLVAIIPFLATAVSASPSNGSFQVKAVDAKDNSVMATVGSLSSNSSEPGGEQPGSEIAASFSCGPLSIDITQEMLDFSKANEDLFNAGRASEMVAHADGWKIIASYFDGKFSTGLPTDGATPGLVALGSDLSGSGVATYMSTAADNCTITDNRIAPSENATYRYSTQQSGGDVLNGEGRWITEEGNLNRVLVTESGNGTYVVNREARSDRLPLYMDTGDSSRIRYLPLQVVDSVDRVFITVHPSGAIDYSFQNSSGKNAPRTNGPVVVQLDASGKIAALSYINGSGVLTGGVVSGATNAQIVANYNIAAKQTWDGGFPKLADLDLSIPFEPQAP